MNRPYIAVARVIFRQIVESGTLVLSHGVQQEIVRGTLTSLDLVNVLREGDIEPALTPKGACRYAVSRGGLGVVAELVPSSRDRSAEQLIVLEAHGGARS